MINNKEGVVTVNIMIIFASIFTLFLVLFDILIVHYGKNIVIRNQKYQLESQLSQYNTYLNINYGMHGLNSDELLKSINNSQTTLVSHKNYNQTIEGTKSLADYAVVKEQILDYMKYRLPVNYLDQVLSKLDLIKKSKASNDVLDMKNEIDEVLGTLEKRITKKVVLASKVNAFTDASKENFLELCKGINSKWSKLHRSYNSIERDIDSTRKKLNKLTKEYKSLEELFEKNYSDLDLKERLDEAKIQLKKEKGDLNDLLKDRKTLFEEINKLYTDLLDLTNIVDKYIDYNKNLFESMVDLEQVSNEVLSKIDDSLINVKKNEEVLLIEIKDFVVEELNKSKELINEHLIYEQYDIDYSRFELILNDVENIIVNYDMTAEIKSSVYATKANISLLERVKENIEVITEELMKEEVFNKEFKIDIASVNVIKEYFNNHNIDQLSKIDKKVDEEKKKYYEEQLDKSQEVYEADIPEKVEIENTFDLYSSSNKGGVFWNSIKTLKEPSNAIYDNVSINEYIMSTFRSAALSSESDYDFFDKYNRIHYFIRGEIEYVLFGSRSESVNILKTSGIIFGVRTIMNGLHVYTDKEKIALSESIGIAVAGWTGFGAPIVSNIIRMGWSVSESVIDMVELFKGGSVPFYKIYANQWQLDLGVIIPDSKKMANVELLDFTYHDYLRFMLLTVDEKVKLNRIMDLISINLSLTDYPSELDQYLTTLNIDVESDIRVFILNINEFNKLNNAMEMSY